MMVSHSFMKLLYPTFFSGSGCSGIFRRHFLEETDFFLGGYIFTLQIERDYRPSTSEFKKCVEGACSFAYLP
jgi:hypothetical protein